MKYILLLICLLTFTIPGWSADELIMHDKLDGVTLGKPSSISYVTGKEGQGARLDTASSSIEYSASSFATEGSIEFDMMFPDKIAADRGFWTLLSDVGAGAGFPGAINVHFRPGNNRLEFGIFDGSDHNWCYSNTSDWEPGRWYSIRLEYGAGGMKLAVDGKVEGSNPYSGGLAKSAKRLGFDDPYVDSPPVVIDNFQTFRTNRDMLEVSAKIVSPAGYGFFEGLRADIGVQEPSTVDLELVDSSGKVVKKLVNEKLLAPGIKTVEWNGKGVREGHYTLRMQISRAQSTQELTAPIFVNTKWKWKKLKAKFDNYFPTGMYYFYEDDASYINRHVDDPAKAKEYYQKTLKDNAEHGINLLMPVWTPKDHIKMMLDAAHDNNIKVVVHLSEIAHALLSSDAFSSGNIIDKLWDSIKDIKDHPALIGYYIIDEPSNSPEMAARILTVKRLLEAMDPVHPSFSCLLGGYEQLLKTVEFQVVLVDIYPIGYNWSKDLTGFASEVTRAYNNAEGKPVWVIPQAFGKPNAWLIPTPAELRAQVWLSVAYGARGIVYFIYQSTTGYQGEWLQGLVDMDLKPIGPGLEEIKHINSDMQKLAPTLLKLKPANFELEMTSDKLIAKTYTGPKNTRYVVLVNKNVTKSAPAVWKGPIPTDMLTGKQIESNFTLEPGAGMLLQLK